MSPQPIVDLANAYFGSQVLFVASDAGVFRRLAEQGRFEALKGNGGALNKMLVAA